MKNQYFGDVGDYGKYGMLRFLADNGACEKEPSNAKEGIKYCYADELDELVHAYATTIHKAQGSEYPIVVMPVLMNHFVMLQRNLVYTGITRAKKILVMVGTKKVLAYAVRNVTVTKRNTLLKERLSGKLIAQKKKED